MCVRAGEEEGGRGGKYKMHCSEMLLMLVGEGLDV